jgi:hypothetical protein
MFFIAPGQVYGFEAPPPEQKTRSGWMLLVHPDFFWNTSLAKSIRQYEFFDYSVNEALFLSEQEESIIGNVVENIRLEYQRNIDKFSQNIIISQIETLLNYSQRFYQRQFITRKVTNHKILDRLEDILTSYFNDDGLSDKGTSYRTIYHEGAECLGKLSQRSPQGTDRIKYFTAYSKQGNRKSKRTAVHH